ncbi:leucine-rich repeat-containing protein [Tanacetum coccineum]
MRETIYFYLMHTHILFIFSLVLLWFNTTIATSFGQQQLAAAAVRTARTCIDKERQTLLDFKAHLQDPIDLLSTWRPEEEADCCQWFGVTCDNQTGHVTMLDLSSYFNINNESILVNLVLVDCAKTCACNDSTVASEPKKGKDTKEYLLGTEEVSVEECCFKKGKRVLTDKDQEAVKECYKEYIGMVKIYYEEAKRSRHGEPGDVAVNCRGTAGKERPQADARIDAEVEEMLDGTPRKKSRTARDDVKMEGNKNKRRNSRNFCGGTTQREETRLVRVRVNRLLWIRFAR